MAEMDDSYPVTPRGPKHSGWQLAKVTLVLAVYSVPALVVLVGGTGAAAWPRRFGLAVCLVVPPMWVVCGTIVESETVDAGDFLADVTVGDHSLLPLVGFPQSGKWAPDDNPVESPLATDFGPDPDLATLRVEYESLVSEAQYRDRLLLRTTYFALGTAGLFAGALSTTGWPADPSRTVPALAMLASVVMLSFAIAANSYKDSRDALWDRIGRLENSVPAFRRRLTTFNTIRSMDLRLLNALSLSSYAVGLTVYLTLLAYGLYLWSVALAV